MRAQEWDNIVARVERAWLNEGMQDASTAHHSLAKEQLLGAVQEAIGHINKVTTPFLEKLSLHLTLAVQERVAKVRKALEESQGQAGR